MSSSRSRSRPARYPVWSVACGVTIGSQPSERAFSCARGSSSGFRNGPAGAMSATRAVLHYENVLQARITDCGANYAVNCWLACVLIWHMHCLCRACYKQLLEGNRMAGTEDFGAKGGGGQGGGGKPGGGGGRPGGGGGGGNR